MSEFLIAIHIDLTCKHFITSQEQMEYHVKPYEGLIARVVAQEKLVLRIKRWNADGWVSVKRKIFRGSHGEETLTIDGLLLITAKDYDEAVELAKGYPIMRQENIVQVCMTIRTA